MSQNIQCSSGKLYLSKEPMVYVDLHNTLEQHQIDGIRFLYKQFKKKNPGVILNDPLGYSHTIQVVLFITAIRQLLKRAVLILCHHDNLSDWTECFQKWTQNFDDLAIDVSNPFLKKFIFITPMDKLETFSRRDWGIIVVDHDDFLQYKKLPAKFNAVYKIYITPHDMKENLHIFSAIFKWFQPKGQLNVDEFKPNTNNLKDVIAKSIIFQAFVEDIVLRRNIILAQPDTYKAPSPVNRVTRKNKDATGTKIKCSKRKPDDSTEVSNVGSKMRCEIDLAGSRYHITSFNSSDVSISNIKNEIPDEQSDVNSAMDVESFIRNQKPIQSDVFTDFVPDFDENTSQCSSKIEDIEEDFHNNNEVGKTYEIDANFAPNLRFNGNDQTIENTENSMQLNYSEDDPQVINTNKKDNDQILPHFNKAKVGNEIENVPAKMEFEDNNKNNKVNTNKQFTETCNDNIELKTNNENLLNKNEAVKSESEKGIVDNKEAGDNLNVIIAKKGFDDKLKELEEQALQKFKGSMLDKIF